MKGRFISFEGIDGAGKSTHIESVASRLRASGHGLVCTREPGGTSLAETLRELMLHSAMDPLTEALLVFAARRDHIRQVILPALARGDTVLCDRFTDASFAYQGGGRGLDVELLTQLERWVQGSLQPDLTLWFDVAPELAARRRAAARDADRFELQDPAFFERVREGYQARLNAAPQRFARIDASLEPAEVSKQIVNVLQARRW